MINNYRLQNNKGLDCVLQKNFRQNRKYFQSLGTVFNEQNLYQTIYLQLFRFP